MMNLKKQHKTCLAKQSSRLRFLAVSRHKKDRYAVRQKTPDSGIKRNWCPILRCVRQAIPTEARILCFCFSLASGTKYFVFRIANEQDSVFLLFLPRRFMFKSCRSDFCLLFPKQILPSDGIGKVWGRS